MLGFIFSILILKSHMTTLNHQNNTVVCVQVLNSKMLEQETHYRQLSQEQLDNFTLDMNTAYARLKGMEEAIDSKI